MSEEPVGEVRAATPVIEPAWEKFVVLQQALDIEVNFQEKGIQGTSTVVMLPLSDDVEWIPIDVRQCEIDIEHITVDGAKAEATYTDPYLLLTTPEKWSIGAQQHGIVARRVQGLTPRQLAEAPVAERGDKGCTPAYGSLRVKLRRAAKRSIVLKTRDSTLSLAGAASSGPDGSDDSKAFKICIPFRTTTIRDGLQFVGLDESDKRYPHVYTRHCIEPGTASCIFPCVDDPGTRVPWKISVKFPRTLADVFDPRNADWPPLGSLGLGNDGHQEPRPPRQAGPMLSEEDKVMEMTVICSGTLVGETTDPEDEAKKTMHFEIANSVAAQHVGFAIGPFEYVELWSECRTEEMDDKLGGNATKIHGYCLPGRADEVIHTCAPAVMATDYFVLHFGKYPFESYKLCFVDDMLPDTAAACSLSFCSTRLLYPEDIIDTEIDNTRILVHSLASQFVGVHIVPDKRSDTWLVVGMQWYMTDIFMKELCGNNHYRFMQKTLADRLVEADMDRPSLHDLGAHLHIGDFELEFMSLKAPLLLFILDQRMKKIPGNTGVMRVISKMISSANINDGDVKETSASAEAFFKTCEKQSQVRCDNFLTQWVKGSGCPHLFVKQKFNKKNTSVEIGIYQTQADRLKPGLDGAVAKRRLQKGEFWREVRELQEEQNNLFAKDVQAHFTGPLSIQIHEADGRPYEHLVEIMENQINGAEFKMTYYTKYKRLKKKRRQKEVVGAAAAAARADGREDGQDDVAYYSCFGDVLQMAQDLTDWGLVDWTDEEQMRMNNESYEWIGIDTDFEWLCEKKTDMPFYMYLAQLQQDRDVVAQQDSMLAFSRGWVHPMASTILVRTLMDDRYFHGIRTMAVRELRRQAIWEMNMLGLAHLVLAFRYFFCFRVDTAAQKGVEEGGQATNTQSTGNGMVSTQATQAADSGDGDGAENAASHKNRPATGIWTPRPNDFSDKREYYVQSAIPGAIGVVKDQSKRCPKQARTFLMDLLVFNDNSSNSYSDQFYVAKLLEALTSSIVTEVDEHARELIFTLDAEQPADREFGEFVNRVIGEIDRYRRMDEWTGSYHNIWTTTALECKQRLMKARIIPATPLDFVQYLQDGNVDFVRIAAFECLVELGYVLKPSILRLFVAVMSGDPSPFVRDRLFKAFCRGMAAIALGEAKKSEKPAVAPAGDDEDALIVEAGDEVTEERRADEARKVDLDVALKALKEELKDNEDLKASMFSALQSPAISVAEHRNLLALCSAMYESEDSLLLTLSYPREWRVKRAARDSVGPGQLIMNFTSSFRTQPRSRIEPVESQAADAARPPEQKKIKLQPRASAVGLSSAANGPSVDGSVPSLTRHASISVAPRAAAADTIAVRPMVATSSSFSGPSTSSASRQPSTALAAAIPPPAAAPPSLPPAPAPAPAPATPLAESSSSRPKPPKKRSSEGLDESERPRKMAKSGSAEPWRKRRMVMLKVNPARISSAMRRSLQSSAAVQAVPSHADGSTIVATPVRSVFPSSPVPESPPTAHGASGGVKVRKPLPSAAPPTPVVAQPASVAVATPSAPAAPSAAPKIKIKLTKK